MALGGWLGFLAAALAGARRVASQTWAGFAALTAWLGVHASLSILAFAAFMATQSLWIPPASAAVGRVRPYLQPALLTAAVAWCSVQLSV